MRNLALAVTVLLSSAASGHAADMAVKARPAPVLEAAYNWSGFYVGGNVGGAWRSGGSDDYSGPVFPGFIVLAPVAAIPTVVPGQLDTLGGGGNRSGVIGGGQIGYNWQADRIVFGLEADVIGSDLGSASTTRSRTFGAPFFAPSVTQTVTVDYGSIDWMATFRGRIGYAADRVLFYATGGAAVAEFGGASATVVNGPGIAIPAGTFTSASGGSSTRWGWTVGGGIEWAFANQWSLAAEYRHADFGSRAATVDIPDGFGTTFVTAPAGGRLTVDQVTARLNYRFGGPVVARY